MIDMAQKKDPTDILSVIRPVMYIKMRVYKIVTLIIPTTIHHNKEEVNE